jgi:glycerophosphoryl diester phosphodiesterase
LLVAHRGGAGLAPENTLTAFQQALERWGADMLELDVRATADGAVVVIHDATVDRTTDGSGAVRALRLEAVRELDAGHRFVGPDGAESFRGRGVRIPLLQEVLESFPRARLNVEIKAREAARPTLEVVRRLGATDRVLIAAEFESNRRDARGYEGPWGASRSQMGPFWLLHRTPFSPWVTPRADAFQVPVRWKGLPVVTRRFVEEAHRRNVPVHVWTVDDPDEMRWLLDLGVDGIQSDRPDVLARVLSEETGRPPAPAHAEEVP